MNPDTRRVELFVLRGGKLHAALADEAGAMRSEVLGVTFAPAAGKLALRWPGGDAAI